MDKKLAVELFDSALTYMDEVYPGEVEAWEEIDPDSFDRMTAAEFLAEYCWVVYVSGFKVAIIREKFPAIKRAFKGFAIEELVRMKDIAPVLRVFNSKRKAECFLRGAKLIAGEGFDEFKRRVKQEGMSALKVLPGIGEITQKQLARDIGLADVAKDDVWLMRFVEIVGAKDEKERAGFLAAVAEIKLGTVDFALWQFASDHGWIRLGYETLDDLVDLLR